MAAVVPGKPTGQVFWPHIIRTMFNTEPLADVAPDRVEPYFHKEAITHVRFQLFPSPAYSKVTSPEAFRTHLRQTVGARFQWCRENRFRVVGLLDETFMFREAREWQWNCPWAGEAAMDAASFARESGLVDCVETVDESKTPREYKAENFVRNWREAGGPPLAWPSVSPRMWDDLQEYTSCYAPFWKRGALPLADQARMIATMAANARRDRPWMCLIWCCGPQKKDGLMVNSGVKAQHILAQMVLAMMHGAGGVNVYGYDPPRWRRDRAEAKPGALLQTGSRPGDERWSGVAHGFRFIERFETAFLGEHYEPVKKGPFWIGRRENLDLAVNVSDQPQKNPFGRGKFEPGGVRYLTAKER